MVFVVFECYLGGLNAQFTDTGRTVRVELIELRSLITPITLNDDREPLVIVEFAGVLKHALVEFTPARQP